MGDGGGTDEHTRNTTIGSDVGWWKCMGASGGEGMHGSGWGEKKRGWGIKRRTHFDLSIRY